MKNLNSSDRLRTWKNFRKEIGTLPFDDAVKQTVHYWSYTPIVKCHIDYSNAESFPDPWVLVLQDGFDDLARALGMLYTLFLSDHGTEHSFKLQIVQSSCGLEIHYLVVIDDGKYTLNYEFNSVLNISPTKESNMTILHDYTSDDLRLHTY
jgi:hypothetical protein